MFFCIFLPNQAFLIVKCTKFGGFLRKLRNKGINPATVDRPYLLRYFKRMAKIKVEITEYRYKQLTKAQLLKIIYDDEFLMSNY